MMESELGYFYRYKQLKSVFQRHLAINIIRILQLLECEERGEWSQNYLEVSDLPDE